MIANESNPQKGSRNETRGFVTSSNEKTGRPRFMQPRWKLAGIDAEGAHHVLQTDDQIIYAIEDGRVVAKEQLGDWRAGRTITAWRTFVAQKRGWDEFYLQILDFNGALTIMGGRPRR